MEMLNRVEFDYGSLAEAFPKVDPLVTPCGDNILVQIRSPKKTTKGGILLVTDVRDTEFWATQVAKVLALGPVAYRFHDRLGADGKLEFWPEGPWCEVGDFVRIPKFGGDRWTVKVAKPDGTTSNAYDTDADYEALIVMFKAKEIIGRITGDPLALKAFI